MNMTELNINLKKTSGKIKPMNCVNNGPTDPSAYRGSYTDFDYYKALNIPYARNHDASLFPGYCGEQIVDVHRIFKNFDADENDPESYNFEQTDMHVKNVYLAGTNVFYRFGTSVERKHRCGSKVPKDFGKWARICEHIIRHYNEGWANGFEYGIEYWEIWNEPDCVGANGQNPFWLGTEEQFLELYNVASKHLKSCFPNIKIGGPAFTSPWKGGFKDKFLDYVVRNNLPLDFYSYHWYGCRLEDLVDGINEARNELDKRGLKDVETSLNEWNYVKGWIGDDWKYTLKVEKSLKASSFIVGAMSIGQSLPVDMLMYYDARPCGMNGLFKNETYEPLKGYYSFAMFEKLAKLGTQLDSEFSKDGIYCLGATDGENSAVMVTHYNDNDDSEKQTVKLCFDENEHDVKVLYYLLDEEHDLELVREEIFTAKTFATYITLPVHTSMFVEIKKM